MKGVFLTSFVFILLIVLNGIEMLQLQNMQYQITNF